MQTTSPDQTSDWLGARWANPALMRALWLVANFLPHGLIYLAAGKPYFALAPLYGLFGELSIMALNLMLPILAILALDRDGLLNIRRALGWRWLGWRTWAWAVVALVLFLAVAPVANWLVGSSPFPYGAGVALKLPGDWPLVVGFLVLWLCTAFGEEIMHRGYLQTVLPRRFGATLGVLVPALLWGLRHLPSDLYWGSSASVAQWASRLIQLYVGALVFGLVRHRSGSLTVTGIAHLLLWMAVILINALASVWTQA